MTRGRHLARRIILALFVLGLVACSSPEGRLIVHNVTRHDVAQVEIDAGGETMILRDLRAGEVVDHEFIIRSDSSVVARFTTKEGKGEVACQADIYLTNGVASVIELWIEDGSCRILEVSGR